MLGAEFLALAERCAPAVAPSTLRAVLKVESGGRAHAIGGHIKHRSGQVFRLSRQPANSVEAIGWATWLLANGYVFDAGIAQVNSSNWNRLGISPQNAFDSCISIRAGAHILTEAYNRAVRQYGPGQLALRAALSAYNTGSFTAGYGNGYVKTVVNAAAIAETPAVSVRPSFVVSESHK